MNISKQVIERLEKLTAERPRPVTDSSLAGARYVVGIPIEGQKICVTLALEDYDRYSVVLRHIEVAHDLALNEAEVKNYLQQCAEQITRRLTYMEEPLALVELAENEGLAQLRSQTPRREDEAILYWEAQVTTQPVSRVKLTRYRWTPGQVEREQVVYPITFARLGQMIEDLVEGLTCN